MSTVLSYVRNKYNFPSPIPERYDYLAWAFFWTWFLGGTFFAFAIPWERSSYSAGLQPDSEERSHTQEDIIDNHRLPATLTGFFSHPCTGLVQGNFSPSHPFCKTRRLVF